MDAVIVHPHPIVRRERNGTIIFSDHDKFRPNLTPKEIFEQGAFGGTYWRKIHSGLTGREYENICDKWNEDSIYAEKLCDGKKDLPWRLDSSLLKSPMCVITRNKYQVHSGTSLAYWESKGWINPQDPYGWIQWYCEFYYGRRTDDDERQIDRWLKFAGPKGRFYLRIVNILKARGAKFDDAGISPVIRQGLHQWAKVITRDDL